ncbi:LysE family translocator [Halomonas sp. DP5Y7-2]|uniref:LysE family translocator n=1 Tax=Halomonas sp. DP5Y7-2 TaxID=2859076 RepID=UPI001C9954F9|nr:LysE family translocator [Halomonas sp. DP5Y7-2]MBY5982854.1 LysE family translocator [Halomonas sp. DP5Y7-2]MED5295318.1 LysE family translocator [Pseudomonadota bacterium]
MTFSADELLAILGFALVASLSPGPVNLLILTAGIGHGSARAMRLAVGSCAGFTLLLGVLAAGLGSVWQALPVLQWVLKAAGGGFVAWLSWKLLQDRGDWGAEAHGTAPGLMTAALMQWLNPKAWIASMAGLGIFTAGRGGLDMAVFTLTWGTVCFASACVWAWCGSHAGQWLADAGRRQLLQRGLAVTLMCSGVLMLLP